MADPARARASARLARSLTKPTHGPAPDCARIRAVSGFHPRPHHRRPAAALGPPGDRRPVIPLLGGAWHA